MKSKCNIVKDILPLYVENMVSADTKRFVEEHLEHCPKCCAELEQLRRPAQLAADAPLAPLHHLKKKLTIKRIQTIFFTAAFVLAMALSVFAFLTSPKFLPYAVNLIRVADNPNGTLTLVFDAQVTGYSYVKGVDDAAGTEVYRINAWNTIWDLYSSRRGQQNMVIDPNEDTNIQVYYASNNGSEDVLIYGLTTDEGSTTLPRLILLPYFLLALLASLLLAVLRFLMRKKDPFPIWIDRAIWLPISYMIAHFCTMGVRFNTYSPQRDFSVIVLAAILLYCAMLSGIGLYKARKGKMGK